MVRLFEYIGSHYFLDNHVQYGLVHTFFFSSLEILKLCPVSGFSCKLENTTLF